MRSESAGRDLETQMKYGYFDDAAHEYVITHPHPPQPWYNYIRNEEYADRKSVV